METFCNVKYKEFLNVKLFSIFFKSMTLVILSEPKLYTAFFIKIGIVFNSEFISYNKIVSSDNKCANSSFILSLFFSAISFNFFVSLLQFLFLLRIFYIPHLYYVIKRI